MGYPKLPLEELKKRRAARAKAWRDANRERVRIQQRRNWTKRRYGITLEKFDEIFESQGKCCKICGGTHPGSKPIFSIDHCHRSGKIRGILCTFCNSMLGYAKDDISILQKGIDYLKENSNANV